jgi:hypothetical protein
MTRPAKQQVAVFSEPVPARPDLHRITPPEGGLAMARVHKKKRTFNPWSPADVRTLKAQAGKATASRIAKQLKRSESAVRQKAAALGISLRT